MKQQLRNVLRIWEKEFIIVMLKTIWQQDREQQEDEPVGSYIPVMTAEKFYEYCSIGYKANRYVKLEGLTAKEQYYKMADGRDEGLSELDEDSAGQFEVILGNRVSKAVVQS